MTKAKTRRTGADLVEAMTEAVTHAKGQRCDLTEHHFAPEDTRLVRASPIPPTPTLPVKGEGV